MEASDLTVAVSTRVRREDCKRTTDDSRFSTWKILVGPSDWEDYSLGKDGAERYRVPNLPKKESAGVYELGVAVLPTGLGREIGKLEPDCIVPVYLGQADNVRTRLQNYGRSGAHLGNGCSTGHCGDLVQKGPGLFVDILARGYPIVFRWVPMENKSAALSTESQILNRFDYAWNTNNNGARRPDDVLQKLEKISSGIKIESSKPLSAEYKSSDRESNNPPFQIFKFGRSQPRLVVDRSHITQESTVVCGVAVGDGGSVCRTPAVPGRQRCAEHKGMRIGGSVRVGISNSNVDSHCGRNASNASHHSAEGKLPLVETGVSESFGSICGFILAGGSPCRNHPVQGRKRCHVHKGRRL